MTRPARGARGDGGLTLTEVLITALILSVVLPLVGGALIAAHRNAANTVGSADAVAGARLALQNIDRQVRSGAGPLHVDGTAGFGLYSAFAADGAVASQPRCLQYKIVDGALRTREFPAAATSRPSWATATLVASGLTTGSRFAIESGTRSVRVELVVQAGSGRPAALQSVLTARNLINPAASACGTFS